MIKSKHSYGQRDEGHKLGYSIREILLSTVKLGYNVTTKIVRYSRDNLGSKPLIWDQKSGHNLGFFKLRISL